MDTLLIEAYYLNSNSNKLELDNKLSTYLTGIYNDQNLKIEFRKGDTIQIDGGRLGEEDDFIYGVKKRTHFIDRDGSYILMLDLTVVQDKHKKIR